ncbi:MAG: ABC transporter permease [Anaerolineaceae bacterium]
MNKILAIFRKELLVRFSSKVEWLYFLILPLFFTFVISGGTGAPQDTRIRLLVTDQANTSYSTLLVNELESSSAVYPDFVTLEKGQRMIKDQTASAHLIIPADFDQAKVQSGSASLNLVELPNNLNAMAASRAVMTAADHFNSMIRVAEASVQSAELVQPFPSETLKDVYASEALTRASDALNSAPSRLTVVQGTTADKIPYDPQANSSTGQIITWVFIPLFGLSAIFAAERTSGTLRRVLVSPISRATYLFGVILSNLVIALAQMLLLMIFGAMVLKVAWFRDPLAIGVMLVASILSAAALGTALGTFVKTESQANGLSILLGMVMAMLSGCWYPIELFPQAVQNASKVLPTRWAVQGMLDVLVRGQGVSGILPDVGILLGFAALFFAVGILRFKYE